MNSKNFKIGDRIAFYENGKRLLGTIDEIDERRGISVEEFPTNLHPNQCRKLKKKEPAIELYVVKASEFLYHAFKYRSDAVGYANMTNGKLMLFKEQRAKNEK